MLQSSSVTRGADLSVNEIVPADHATVSSDDAVPVERPKRARVFSLDVLRGLAIVLVLVRHMPQAPTSGVTYWFYELGWTGVDLFFVLSGYLISGLLYNELDKTGGIKVGRFWLRRGFKIWPSYIVCYGGWTICKIAKSLLTNDRAQAAASFKGALPNLIFIQNYVWLNTAWPHSWSLAIEEHFYLTLPLLFLLACAFRKQNPLAGLPVVAVLVCVSVLCFRWCTYSTGIQDWKYFYYPTHMRVDALAFGVLLGYLHRYHAERFRAVGRKWPYLLVLVVPLLMTAVLFPITASPVSYVLGFTLLYLAYGALVIIAATYPDFGSRRIFTKWAAWMGIYSYTIYLAHSVIFRLPVATLVRENFTAAGHVWGNRILFWLLSIGGGLVLSLIVERPFLRLRERLYSSRAENAAPAHSNFHAAPLGVIGSSAQSG